MRARYVFFVWLLGWSFSLAAWGGDYIVSREVYEDRSGTLPIEEAVQAKFLPAKTIFTGGYTASAFWFRIVVPPRPQGSELILRIRPAILDEVTLYEPDPLKPGGWKNRVTGDRTPFLARELDSVALGLAVKAGPTENVYYLRLKTGGASIFNVEALDPNEAKLKEVSQWQIMLLYLGGMLWMLFWGVNDYYYSRQPVVAWFVLLLGAQICRGFAVMGYLAPQIPANGALVDGLTSLSVCAGILCAVLFHRALLKPFAPSPLGMRGLDILIAVNLADLVFLAVGRPDIALRLNAWMSLPFVLLLIVLAFTARTEAMPGRHLLRTIYLLLGVSMIVIHIPFLGGLFEATEWNLNFVLMQGIGAAFLMFVLLHQRSRQILRDAKQAVLNLELTRQHLELEKAQRETQSRFMAMLSHELKTPMSVIRMALGMKEISPAVKRHAQQSVQDMDAVVERSLQADRLDQHQLVARRQPCRVDNLLAELRDASASPQRLHIESETLPLIETDNQLLHVVLANLIDNALKYAEPDSAIRIDARPSVQQERQGILVCIANTPGSAGMPDPQRVFEKYYRSPGAGGKTGSGLGLYLVRSMSELIGGQVRYCPTPNEIRFELWIPR
jgi:signal transduction histidine kinase